MLPIGEPRSESDDDVRVDDRPRLGVECVGDVGRPRTVGGSRDDPDEDRGIKTSAFDDGETSCGDGVLDLERERERPLGTSSLSCFFSRLSSLPPRVLLLAPKSSDEPMSGLEKYSYASSSRKSSSSKSRDTVVGDVLVTTGTTCRTPTLCAPASA